MKIKNTILIIFIILKLFNGEVIQPSNSNIFYSGRIDSSNENIYYFSWSGVTINIVISGTTSIQTLLTSSGQNFLNVIVNQEISGLINITSSTPDVFSVLENADSSQTYTIELTHRNEPLCGIVGFYGFIVDQGAVIQVNPNTQITRKIEVIGDSISCGYGILGTWPCHFSVPTEDNYDTYGRLVASRFNAIFQTEAWSGKGLVRNYGYDNITSPDTMPDLYNAIIPNNYPNFTEWNFNEYDPDVVIINLGTNDYSTAPTPPEDLFISSYIDFIDFIRSKYSNNPNIFLLCGPMISDPCCEYVEAAASKSNSIYIPLQNILNSTNTGCDGHPNYIAHQTMANMIIPVISETMNWD